MPKGMKTFVDRLEKRNNYLEEQNKQLVEELGGFKKSVDQGFATRREARSMSYYQLLRVLKALLVFVNVFAFAECKTIGNGHPEGLHCFSCTFNDIANRVKRAVDFWEKDDMYKESPS